MYHSGIIPENKSYILGIWATCTCNMLTTRQKTFSPEYENNLLLKPKLKIILIKNKLTCFEMNEDNYKTMLYIIIIIKQLPASRTWGKRVKNVTFHLNQTFLETNAWYFVKCRYFFNHDIQQLKLYISVVLLKTNEIFQPIGRSSNTSKHIWISMHWMNEYWMHTIIQLT